MSESEPNPTEYEKESPRLSLFWVTLTAFFLSGVSGLIYQTVWVRMLTRYIGSTTSSTATVLCVFMGGLALGAFFGGRLADRLKQKLRGYALLEIGIAVISLLASFAVLTVLGGVYVAHYALFQKSYAILTLCRIGFAAACLLPPSLLMGATLPVLVAFVTRSGAYFQHGLARLYAVNTFGAVVGVLLTGFFLIGALGERRSLFLAAGLNLVAALAVILLIGRLSPEESENEDSEAAPPRVIPAVYTPGVRLWARVTLFFSGFTALAYEVLWSRMLTLPLRTSIYGFSFMLALLLSGIAAGSWVSTRLPVAKNRPLAVYGFIEVLIGFLTATGLLLFGFAGRATLGYKTDFYLGILTAAFMVLPVGIAFGCQFPVAVRCCLAKTDRPGRETGWAYSVNTLGSILGSLAAGFLLIPRVGTANTMAVLALVNVFLGMVLLGISPRIERGRFFRAATAFAIVATGLIIFSGNSYRTAIDARAAYHLGPDRQIYGFYEGVAGTTVPAGAPDNPMARHLFINGTGMTVLVSETKLMAHLPMALVPDPKKVLVVCFGMGTTVRSASRFPGKDIRIDAVDIVPRVFDCFGFFHPDAETIVSRPGLKLFAEDGRNFLLVRKGRYDVITIDPAPPIYSAGTVNLYSREFLQLCKSKIQETGVVCLWLPPYAGSELLMIMKTFLNVFPGASLWGGLYGTTGFYLIGGHRSFEQTAARIDRLAARLSDISDLSEWDSRYGEAAELRRLYIAGPEQLEILLKGIPEVTDDLPYTEFPLWRGALWGNAPRLDATLFRNLMKARKMKEPG